MKAWTPWVKQRRARRSGDAISAYTKAPVKIDARYANAHSTSQQAWNCSLRLVPGRTASLRWWESSQNVYGYQYGLADQLGVAPADVRIVSPYLGGSFGSRSFLPQTTAVIALGAKMIGRPVKLEATRADASPSRPTVLKTRHRVRLAATREGRLQSLMHDGWEVEFAG